MFKKQKVNNLDKKFQQKQRQKNLVEKNFRHWEKIADIASSATTAVLNTKITGVENKIPDVSTLVKKADYDAKPIHIERKYFTTADYNKFVNLIIINLQKPWCKDEAKRNNQQIWSS